MSIFSELLQRIMEDCMHVTTGFFPFQISGNNAKSQTNSLCILAM